MIREVLPYNSSKEVEPLLGPLDQREDIAMGAWKASSNELYTSGASTCIVLVGYNDDTRQGLIGHFSNLTTPESDQFSDGKAFREAVDAIESLGERSATSIWVGGGSPCLKDGVDQVEGNREYAEVHLRERLSAFEIPEEELLIEWSEPKTVIDVELDCVTGVLAIHKYPSGPTQLTLQAVHDAAVTRNRKSGPNAA